MRQTFSPTQSGVSASARADFMVFMIFAAVFTPRFVFGVFIDSVRCDFTLRHTEGVGKNFFCFRKEYLSVCLSVCLSVYACIYTRRNVNCVHSFFSIFSKFYPLPHAAERNRDMIYLFFAVVKLKNCFPRFPQGRKSNWLGNHWLSRFWQINANAASAD